MPDVSVISSGHKSSSHKNLLIITGLLVLITGIIAAVILVQTRQQANIKAWDCDKYNFLVTSIGSVTVTNDQSVAEPAQKATVYINGSPVATFDVPALESGQSQTLGAVDVPPSGEFTWSVVGSSDCSDSGSYQGPSATPTLPPPTQTPSPTPPEISVTPTISPSPTPLIPTATPVITEIPTATPNPTTTPAPTITPIITEIPTVTTVPSATPTTRPPDNPPSPPNRCNGDCHSDANCGYAEDGTKLVCVNNFCRHPSCTDQISCHCPPPFSTPKPTPTPILYAHGPTPTPAQTLVKSGSALPTILTTFGGLLLIGIGLILAI